MFKYLLIAFLLVFSAQADYTSSSDIILVSSESAIDDDVLAVAAPGQYKRIELVYFSFSNKGEDAAEVALADFSEDFRGYEAHLVTGSIYAHNFRDGEYRLPRNTALNIDITTDGTPEIFYTIAYKVIADTITD